MRIVKVFNNSVVLAADDEGRETVVLGRGVGFQRASGDPVDEALVEKRFVPGGADVSARVAAYLEDVPLEDIAVAQEIVVAARAALGTAVPDTAVLPLADHLSFALRRIREGIAIDYPLRWEVNTLYPREFEFARTALALVEQKRGVTLPEGEAVSLTLHLVNAQFGVTEMAETMQLTTAMSRALALIGEELGAPIEEDSVDAARFVTHLRYLVVRRMRGLHPASVDSALGEALRTADPDAYRVAMQVADQLAGDLGWDIDDDERLYLAIHVRRLRTAHH
ncbi:PRD domain-containing protein [Herbiconiux sp. L3-i23]|uniref:PRD domain-containing protein n=1 Tax=Herbiconiux sp. L3-i23 TaxID=2905871 RepID=UPI002072B15E|nr:PRD domain-containing protein [Herbiconiux sp. L3-i23]